MNTMFYIKILYIPEIVKYILDFLTLFISVFTMQVGARKKWQIKTAGKGFYIHPFRLFIRKIIYKSNNYHQLIRSPILPSSHFPSQYETNSEQAPLPSGTK